MRQFSYFIYCIYFPSRLFLFSFHSITHNSWIRLPFVFIIASLAPSFLSLFPPFQWIFHMKISPFDYTFIQFNFLARAFAHFLLLCVCAFSRVENRWITLFNGHQNCSEFLIYRKRNLPSRWKQRTEKKEKFGESEIESNEERKFNFSNIIEWADERQSESERPKKKKMEFNLIILVVKAARKKKQKTVLISDFIWCLNWVSRCTVAPHRPQKNTYAISTTGGRESIRVVKRKENDKNKERKNTRC